MLCAPPVCRQGAEQGRKTHRVPATAGAICQPAPRGAGTRARRTGGLQAHKCARARCGTSLSRRWRRRKEWADGGEAAYRGRLCACRRRKAAGAAAEGGRRLHQLEGGRMLWWPQVMARSLRGGQHAAHGCSCVAWAAEARGKRAASVAPQHFGCGCREGRAPERCLRCGWCLQGHSCRMPSQPASPCAAEGVQQRGVGRVSRPSPGTRCDGVGHGADHRRSICSVSAPRALCVPRCRAPCPCVRDAAVPPCARPTCARLSQRVAAACLAAVRTRASCGACPLACALCSHVCCCAPTPPPCAYFSVCTPWVVIPPRFDLLMCGSKLARVHQAARWAAGRQCVRVHV